MPGSNYQDDIQYTIASSLEVFQGKPNNAEGQEGEERWCWVDGEGLYLAKKYAGEWRFLASSVEVLEAGVASSDSTAVQGGGSSSTGTGNFTTLSVSNSTSLNTSTGIAGTLAVTATSLTSFPTSANLQITNSKLNTIQDIQTNSGVQFNEIGLGTAPSGEAGNIELTSILGINAADIINSVLKLKETDYTNTAGSSLTDGLGLEDLTQTEANQLKNIGTSTISEDQWGYVGNLNQNLTVASSVQFNQITIKNPSVNYSWKLNPDASTGKLFVEPPPVGNNTFVVGSSSRDDANLQNYNYTSGLFGGDGWSIYEQESLHNLEIDNLLVRGTLSVYELLIQQVRATNGSLFITSACKLVNTNSITHVANSSPDEYILNFETDSDNSKPHPFADGDLLLSRQVDISGNSTDVIRQVKFTVTDASHGTSSQLKATNYEWTGMAGNLPAIGKTTQHANGMDFVRVGNTTDANRKGGIYLTSDDSQAPFMDVFDDVSGWEQWDGISSAFGFQNGSFDNLTGNSNSTSWTKMTGSEWYHKGSTGGTATFQSTGGVLDSGYAQLYAAGGLSQISQNITFPTITTGTYVVKISWYAKGDSASAKVALQRKLGENSFDDYYNEDGSFESASSSSTIYYHAMGDITTPSQQPTINSEWQKYEWDVTITAGASSQTDWHLFFTATGGNGYYARVDNIRIALPNKVKTRVGKLEGVGANGYGLWGENVWLTGRITASSGYIGDELQGWEISSTGIKNASTNTYISSGQSTVGLDNGGIYLGGNGTFSAGDSDSNGIKWDGSNLTVRGNIHVGSSGSVDNSLLPSVGKTIRIATGGYGTSTASLGLFEVDSSTGEITSRLGSAFNSGTSVRALVAVWNPAADNGNGAFDTGFSTDGVDTYTSASSLNTAISGIDNGKIVIVIISAKAEDWISTQGSGYDSTLAGNLQNIGVSKIAMESTHGGGNVSSFSGFATIGMKKASAHTGATDIVSSLGDGTGLADLTVNLKSNQIDILDFTGPLNDFDAQSTTSFDYSRADGYTMKRSNLSGAGANDRVVLSFPMPYVRAEDTSNVYVYFTSKNLGDEGASPVKLKLNGTTIMSNVEDPDDDYQYPHSIYNINANDLKTDITDVNVFQFTMQMDGTGDTNYIYKFELRDSGTNQVYSGGYQSTPEGNLFANPGFEVAAVQDQTSANSWYINNSTNGYILDLNEYWSGGTSLKFTAPTSSYSADHFSQDVVLPAAGTYVLRWRFRFENTITSKPTFSIYTTDIATTTHNGANIHAFATSTGTLNYDVSTGGKVYNNYDVGGVGSLTDDYAGEWQQFEYKFVIPSTFTFNGNRTTQSDMTWKFQFYSSNQTSQVHYHDHLQIFQVQTNQGSEQKGLYMSADRMGFYNGTGGLNGWATLLKDDGTFFFGDKNNSANLITPSSGGQFIRYDGSKLQVNADMIAGVIQSENWGTSTGTRINLADGTINTGGTSNPKFQLASDGSVNLNGASLTGGTITGQLFQTNYAEGAVDFVTKLDSGVNAVTNFTVTVNGVNRLLCERIAESNEMDFGEADDNSSGTTKYLGIYGYDYQGVNTLNRSADTSANTRVAFTGGAPFYIGAAATNDGNNDNDEVVHFRFRIGTQEDNFYISHKTRIVPTTPNKGRVRVRAGYDGSNWTDIINKESSNDFYEAGTQTWTLPSGLVVYGFATSDYQDSGDIIDMKCQFYLSGTASGMYSSSTGLEIYYEQTNDGSYIQTSSATFGPAVWKVYN